MGPSATTEDNSFGSRKARSSFGKGFFKIRGGKKTTSTPNLGKPVPSLPVCACIFFRASSGNDWLFTGVNDCFLSTIDHFVFSKAPPIESTLWPKTIIYSPHKTVFPV